MADAEGAEARQCSLCKCYLDSAKTYKTKCKHEFHQSCIANYFMTNTTCPTCQAVCFEKPATPSQNTRQQKSQVLTASGNTPMGSRGSAGLGASQTELIENTVKSAVQGMENELLTMLSDKMAQLIDTNKGTPRSFTSDLSRRPDKIGHIFNSWKLRFSGTSDAISVDNFNYRV